MGGLLIKMYNSDIKKIMLKYSQKKLTRAKAIRIYCREVCCAGDMKSWQKCDFEACPLFNFRLGRETSTNRTSIKKRAVLPIEFGKNDNSQEGQR